MRKLAIIDLGSNAIRMNLLEVTEEGVNLLLSERKTARLSEGMGEEKTLKPVAVERTLAIMRSFVREIEVEGITEIHAVATAAMRQAKNPEVVLEPLREMGIHLQIISGEQEAYFDFLGVMEGCIAQDCVILDIGGASAEVIAVRGGEAKGMVSIPLGAVVLTERYLPEERLSERGLTAATAAVDSLLAEIPFLPEMQGVPVVGVGGTARVLGSIVQCSRKEELPLQNYEVDAERIYSFSREIIGTTTEERKQIEGMTATRAEIIGGGIAVLGAVMKRIGAPSLIVSTRGVREGLQRAVLEGLKW